VGLHQKLRGRFDQNLPERAVSLETEFTNYRACLKSSGQLGTPGLAGCRKGSREAAAPGLKFRLPLAAPGPLAGAGQQHGSGAAACPCPAAPSALHAVPLR